MLLSFSMKTSRSVSSDRYRGVSDALLTVHSFFRSDARGIREIGRAAVSVGAAKPYSASTNVSQSIYPDNHCKSRSSFRVLRKSQLRAIGYYPSC